MIGPLLFQGKKTGQILSFASPELLLLLLLVSHPKDRQIKDSLNVIQYVVHMRGLSLSRNFVLVQKTAGQATNGQNCFLLGHAT